MLRGSQDGHGSIEAETAAHVLSLLQNRIGPLKSTDFGNAKVHPAQKTLPKAPSPESAFEGNPTPADSFEDRPYEGTVSLLPPSGKDIMPYQVDIIPDDTYGPRLGRAFQELNEENRRLKHGLEGELRSNAHMEAQMARRSKSHFLPTAASGLGIDEYRGAARCECSKLIESALDIMDNRLACYERINWQRRIEIAEAERDELAVRATAIAERLAQLEASLLTNPFHAAQVLSPSVPISGTGNNRELMRAIKDAYRRLAMTEEANEQLERRLLFERSMARAWQPDLKAMQRQLWDYFDQLDKMINRNLNKGVNALKDKDTPGGGSSSADAAGRGLFDGSGGPGGPRFGEGFVREAKGERGKGVGGVGAECHLVRGAVASGGSTPRPVAVGLTRTERESLRLLGKAKERIEGDARRLNVYTTRIGELENEAAQMRVRLSEAESNAISANIRGQLLSRKVKEGGWDSRPDD